MDFNKLGPVCTVHLKSGQTLSPISGVGPLRISSSLSLFQVRALVSRHWNAFLSPSDIVLVREEGGRFVELQDVVKTDCTLFVFSRRDWDRCSRVVSGAQVSSASITIHLESTRGPKTISLSLPISLAELRTSVAQVLELTYEPSLACEEDGILVELSERALSRLHDQQHVYVFSSQCWREYRLIHERSTTVGNRRKIFTTPFTLQDDVALLQQFMQAHLSVMGDPDVETTKAQLTERAALFGLQPNPFNGGSLFDAMTDQLRKHEQFAKETKDSIYARVKNWIIDNATLDLGRGVTLRRWVESKCPSLDFYLKNLSEADGDEVLLLAIWKSYQVGIVLFTGQRGVWYCAFPPIESSEKDAAPLLLWLGLEEKLMYSSLVDRLLLLLMTFAEGNAKKFTTWKGALENEFVESYEDLCSLSQDRVSWNGFTDGLLKTPKCVLLARHLNSWRDKLASDTFPSVPTQFHHGDSLFYCQEISIPESNGMLSAAAAEYSRKKVFYADHLMKETTQFWIVGCWESVFLSLLQKAQWRLLQELSPPPGVSRAELFNTEKSRLYVIEGQSGQMMYVLRVPPGYDIVRMYALAHLSFLRHRGTRGTHLRFFCITCGSADYVKISGLSELEGVLKDSIVILGRVEEFAKFLSGRQARADESWDLEWNWSANDLWGHRHITMGHVHAVLVGSKLSFWGNLAGVLAESLYSLGVCEIIHFGSKVGTLVDTADVGTRVFCPKKFVLRLEKGTAPEISTTNCLLDELPSLQRTRHFSLPTPFDEDPEVISAAKKQFGTLSIDCEASYFARAAQDKNRRFGALYFAANYVRALHEAIQSTELCLLGAKTMVLELPTAANDHLYNYLKSVAKRALPSSLRAKPQFPLTMMQQDLNFFDSYFRMTEETSTQLGRHPPPHLVRRHALSLAATTEVRLIALLLHRVIVYSNTFAIAAEPRYFAVQYYETPGKIWNLYGPWNPLLIEEPSNRPLRDADLTTDLLLAETTTKGQLLCTWTGVLADEEDAKDWAHFWGCEVQPERMRYFLYLDEKDLPEAVSVWREKFQKFKETRGGPQEEYEPARIELRRQTLGAVEALRRKATSILSRGFLPDSGVDQSCLQAIHNIEQLENASFYPPDGALDQNVFRRLVQLLKSPEFLSDADDLGTRAHALLYNLVLELQRYAVRDMFLTPMEPLKVAPEWIFEQVQHFRTICTRDSLWFQPDVLVGNHLNPKYQETGKRLVSGQRVFLHHDDQVLSYAFRVWLKVNKMCGELGEARFLLLNSADEQALYQWYGDYALIQHQSQDYFLFPATHSECQFASVAMSLESPLALTKAFPYFVVCASPHTVEMAQRLWTATWESARSLNAPLKKGKKKFKIIIDTFRFQKF